jgi:hypothetical protein
MDATSFFTESQAQFKESQTKYTELLNDAQNQLNESQKKLMNTWMEIFPTGMSQVNPSENFAKAQTFQRELIESSLNAQKVTFNLAMESQKQFWDNYFQTTQKMTQAISNT